MAEDNADESDSRAAEHVRKEVRADKDSCERHKCAPYRNGDISCFFGIRELAFDLFIVKKRQKT